MMELREMIARAINGRRTKPSDDLSWSDWLPEADAVLEVLAQQEPVAWREFDGEGGYDYRSFADNEDFRDEYIKRNGDEYATWVEPLYAAPGAQAAVQNGWQPIETAPKGTFLLLGGPSGYTTVPFVCTTGRMCSDYKVGRWIDHANDDLLDWGFEPTHWMPLPEQPK